MSISIGDYDYAIERRRKETHSNQDSVIKYEDLLAIFNYASISQKRNLQKQNSRLDKLESQYDNKND